MGRSSTRSSRAWHEDTSSPIPQYAVRHGRPRGGQPAARRRASAGGGCEGVTEDVWSAQDTTPDDIEAALREMLRERHAANEALAPARVLNLVVIVDRSWKGEIANRLERVGRYHASRTILCAVEEGRTTLDAVAVMSYDEPSPGVVGVMHEQVEIDLGPDAPPRPRHDRRPDRRVGPPDDDLVPARARRGPGGVAAHGRRDPAGLRRRSRSGRCAGPRRGSAEFRIRRRSGVAAYDAVARAACRELRSARAAGDAR